jgi:putative membrane protein
MEAVMWWDHDFGWAGWLAMWLGMTGFWVLIAVLVLALVRMSRQPGSQEPDARQVLERRLARGEIDVAEYEERLAALERSPR